jgi:hypothetical protein
MVARAKELETTLWLSMLNLFWVFGAMCMVIDEESDEGVD